MVTGMKLSVIAFLLSSGAALCDSQIPHKDCYVDSSATEAINFEDADLVLARVVTCGILIAESIAIAILVPSLHA